MSDTFLEQTVLDSVNNTLTSSEKLNQLGTSLRDIYGGYTAASNDLFMDLIIKLDELTFTPSRCEESIGTTNTILADLLANH